MQLHCKALAHAIIITTKIPLVNISVPLCEAQRGTCFTSPLISRSLPVHVKKTHWIASSRMSIIHHLLSQSSMFIIHQYTYLVISHHPELLILRKLLCKVRMQHIKHSSASFMLSIGHAVVDKHIIGDHRKQRWINIVKSWGTLIVFVMLATS